MLPGDGMQVKPSSHQAIGDRMDGAAAMSTRGERTLLPEGSSFHRPRLTGNLWDMVWGGKGYITGRKKQSLFHVYLAYNFAGWGATVVVMFYFKAMLAVVLYLIPACLEAAGVSNCRLAERGGGAHDLRRGHGGKRLRVERGRRPGGGGSCREKRIHRAALFDASLFSALNDRLQLRGNTLLLRHGTGLLFIGQARISFRSVSFCLKFDFASCVDLRHYVL